MNAELQGGAWIDDDVRTALAAIFPDSAAALAIAGAADAGLPRSWREEDLNTSTPIDERIRALQETLRQHLHLVAAQMPEFTNEYDQARLRGEALAILISMRELHRHVPELLTGPSPD